MYILSANAPKVRRDDAGLRATAPGADAAVALRAAPHPLGIAEDADLLPRLPPLRRGLTGGANPPRDEERGIHQAS